MSKRLFPKAGVIAILLLGILILLGHSYWSVTHPNTSKTGLYFSAVLMLQPLGVSLIGFAVLGLLLEAPNWTGYFSRRLGEVIYEDKYLASLSQENLKELVARIYKILFKDSTINKKDGFLHYFQNHLHTYINAPYREDVNAHISLIGDAGDTYTVYDRVSYTCRKYGNNIQEEISWLPDANTDEFKDVRYVKFFIKYPIGHKESGKQKEVFNSTGKETDYYKKPITFSLEEYADVDGLIVITEAEYCVYKSRFQYWEMAYPTKNFLFSLSYPANYTVQVKPLVLHSENVQINVSHLLSSIEYACWMLPKSGLAWRFIERETPIAKQEEDKNTDIVPITGTEFPMSKHHSDES